MIPSEEEETTMAMFGWSDGTYLRLPDETDAQAHESIARDARAEFEHNREAATLAGLEFADPPADDDPRWSKIDDVGRERALRLWQKCLDLGTSLMSIDADLAPDETRRLTAEHYRVYRILLMCRMRRPEWFLR